MLRKVDNSMFVAFDKIKELADKQGISINVLEEKLGYGTNTLYRLKRSNPSSKVLREIADYFGVSTDYLLGRTDNPKIANDQEKFFFEGKEVDVEQLASTAMRFNGKPLTDQDKKSIQSIIEAFLRSQEGGNG
jgi:transcriptional regulator with XRE-family HTH domain